MDIAENKNKDGVKECVPKRVIRTLKYKSVKSQANDEQETLEENKKKTFVE